MTLVLRVNTRPTWQQYCEAEPGSPELTERLVLLSAAGWRGVVGLKTVITTAYQGGVEVQKYVMPALDPFAQAHECPQCGYTALQ